LILAEEAIKGEKRRIARAGVVGAGFYLLPLAVVAFLRGESPWEVPYYHVAIPIVVVCLVPVSYLLMPLFDSVLIFGRPRPTIPRAALIARCVITNAMGVLALWVFFHAQSLKWFLVLWALGLPAVFGIVRRIRAYQGALYRIVSGEAEEPE